MDGAKAAAEDEDEDEVVIEIASSYVTQVGMRERKRNRQEVNFVIRHHHAAKRGNVWRGLRDGFHPVIDFGFGTSHQKVSSGLGFSLFTNNNAEALLSHTQKT